MKLSFLLPTLALSLLLPALAAAEPSAADRASAREMGKEGEAALARKDFTTAADRYGRAEALFHAPTLLLGLARAQVGLGKVVDAQETYRRIVNEPVPASAPPAFTEAVASARTEMAAVAPRIAWITITATGADAAITLDGQPLPAAALGARRPVDPGAHEIVASVRGAVVKRTTVTMGEGRSETVTLALNAPPGSAPGAAPPPPLAGGAPLAPLASPPPDAPAPASGSLRKTLGFVSLGVGGAGLIVGAATGAVVLSQHGTLATDCPGGKCPPQFVSKLNTYNTMGAVSTAGFIAGGALAVLGVVLVVTAPRGAPAGTTVGLSLSPTVGGGAFGAEGSF